MIFVHFSTVLKIICSEKSHFIIYNATFCNFIIIPYFSCLLSVGAWVLFIDVVMFVLWLDAIYRFPKFAPPSQRSYWLGTWSAFVTLWECDRFVLYTMCLAACFCAAVSLLPWWINHRAFPRALRDRASAYSPSLITQCYSYHYRNTYFYVLISTVAI